MRKHRDTETDEAIRADFQQNSREDYTAGRRRLHVRQRQPSMQRKQRHLNGKAREEREKYPQLQTSRQLSVGSGERRGQFGNRETQHGGASLFGIPKYQSEKSKEREHTPRQREDKELHRRISTLFT